MVTSLPETAVSSRPLTSNARHGPFNLNSTPAVCHSRPGRLTASVSWP